MIAPTHAGLAITVGLIFGIPKTAICYITAGSLLPDIDHPRSAIGRVFFFVSAPLNRYFGHRKLIHSLVLWAPVTIIGFLYFQILGWIGLGAITHVLLDCWNTTGVELLTPITEKIFVLGSRKYRIASGSRSEFVVLCLFILLMWGSWIIDSKGGVRNFVSDVIGSYELARGQYEKAGMTICYMKGKLRFEDGEIEQGAWLVIGTEKLEGIALYDKKRNRVLHLPKEGMFQQVNLEKTKNSWQRLTINGFSELISNEPVFTKMGDSWICLKKGDVIFGKILYQKDLEIKQDKISSF
ncbi:MAG: metal-dependent hydrolase [Candidatus Margulisiibacteriota bacterium]|jgi:inner membrane protein